MRLKADHKWKAKPGYKIFVADRGAVRFDFPGDWTVTPGPDAIKFHDRPPPDDNCVLQVTVFHLPPDVDWSSLPVAELLRSVNSDDDEQRVISRGEIVAIRRGNVDLAWMETRLIDPGENREAYSRTCLARGANVQALISLDFWPEDAAHLAPVWDEVLRSLRLGEYVKDPRTGARYGYG